MSTDRQESSIDRQRSQVLPYAEKHGYAIVREYADPGIAGDEIAKRKEFQRMLRDAQTGAFRAILCDDKDRFGRFDSIDLGEIVAPLRRKGVWLDTVAQGKIDWHSFAGRITDAVRQEAKHQEINDISRRMLSKQLMAVKAGKYVGGPPIYGYRLEPEPTRGKIHVPDGHKADVVRFIFRRYDEGATIGQIIRELFERGIRSPRGGARWSRNVVWELLQKRKYLGHGVWGVKPMGKRHRHGGNGQLVETKPGEPRQQRLPVDSWIILVDSHEPLIDRELFERVQAKLKGNRKRTTPHTGGGGFVLTRLLVCGHCGGFMLGCTRKGVHVYSCGRAIQYGKGVCNLNTIQEAPLVRLLLRKLQDAFLDPANMKKLRDEVRAQDEAAKSEGNLQALEKRAGQLKRKIEQGAARLLELPKEVVADAAAALARLKKERADLLDEIKHIKASSPSDDLEKQIASAEALLWRLQDAQVNDDWPLLRELLRETFDHVELRWTHVEHPKQTRSRLEGGVIYLRQQTDINLSYEGTR
jgi:DNA invertase Pin-like site-specific DNA recombinase